MARKFLLWLSLGLVMLSSAWMKFTPECIPGHAIGTINKKSVVIALELTPFVEGWAQYLDFKIEGDRVKSDSVLSVTRMDCMSRQIRQDLFFIASYTLWFVLMVKYIFTPGWRPKLGIALAGLVALFDLLENLGIHVILKGFKNEDTSIGTLSDRIELMFDASLTKWTLLMLLILWLFHAAVRLKGWWFDAGKLGLLGSIMLFLWMPVWDLTQPVQVPSVVLIVYLAVLVIVFVTVLIKPPGSRRNA